MQIGFRTKYCATGYVPFILISVLIRHIEWNICNHEITKKIAKSSPGDPAVKTTISMRSSLRGRSVTRGVSRPYMPHLTHIMVLKTSSPGFARVPAWNLRLNTERP